MCPVPPVAMSLFLKKPKPKETERRKNIFLLIYQESKVENLMEIIQYRVKSRGFLLNFIRRVNHGGSCEVLGWGSAVKL